MDTHIKTAFAKHFETILYSNQQISTKNLIKFGDVTHGSPIGPLLLHLRDLLPPLTFCV